MFFFGISRVLAVCTSFFVILVPCNGQLAPGSISPTSVCKRWAHSSVVFDKTLYIYGGKLQRVRSDTVLETSTSNRDFVALDLKNNFTLEDTSTPFRGLPVPPIPGPAKVSQGTFWVSNPESKFTLYGGSFSPDPQNKTDRVEELSLWSYYPQTSTWKEEKTQGGSILRASRGASTYHNGVGYYRGGQIDNSTTPNWPSGSDGTVILSGMLKVDLATATIVNETQAPGDDKFEFEKPGSKYRDGNLVPITFNGRDYLINFGGGGPNGNGLPLNNVYVYDIERPSWYRQPVYGEAPKNTRGGCVVANYAPDNSSIQIILYGGLNWNQNRGEFEPVDSLWILTIPGFQWIPVASSNIFQGPGTRQDHTCHAEGSQMLVVGGKNDSSGCEGSGIWVLDTTRLMWQNNYIANTFYYVPELVSSIIGGDSNGGAPWEGLPKIQPPNVDSPFYNITSLKASTKNKLSAGVIAGSLIGSLVVVATIGLVMWHLYRRHAQQGLDEAPLPPQTDDQGFDPAKNVYYGSTHEISELASPVLQSPAPRYSTLSGWNTPSQLHGDSALPVELYSPPLSYELPSGSMGVYEVHGRKDLEGHAVTESRKDLTESEPLPEVPVPPPAGRN
ncbi:hypothetical protein TWF718_009349 [Orbilia javanica]|uniref:Kelch repeat-containing protein n=1 Tax=Orbilia javanica TaxID=47235 RepID=A0AAN8MVW0_9PEZI